MNDKRRLIDQIGDSPTFVAEGVRLTGDLGTPGPLVVCGTIRGDGRVGGTLRMSVTAQWEGEIHAAAGVVAGRINGRLVIEGKLEVAGTAVIRADIHATQHRDRQGGGHRRGGDGHQWRADRAVRGKARALSVRCGALSSPSPAPPALGPSSQQVRIRRSSQVGPDRCSKNPQCPP